MLVSPQPIACRTGQLFASPAGSERRADDIGLADQRQRQRRAHPYHGTTRNRCANRRFPRSRPTIEAVVIGSLTTKLCVLLPPCAHLWGRPQSYGGFWVGVGCDPNRSQSAIAAGLAIGPLERFEQGEQPDYSLVPPTLRKAILSDTQPLPGSRPRPDGWNSATGPASAARRTPPARTRPAGRGC